MKYNRFRYVGKITVGKFGFFIHGVYFHDSELPTTLPKLNMIYGGYKVMPYSHITSDSRMNEFRRALHSGGGYVR